MRGNRDRGWETTGRRTAQRLPERSREAPATQGMRQVGDALLGTAACISSASSMHQSLTRFVQGGSRLVGKDASVRGSLSEGLSTE